MNYHIGAYMWVDDDGVENAWRQQNPDADENQGYYWFESEATVPQPGAVVLDFTCPAERGEFEFNGTWKIASQPWLVSDDDERQVVDLRRVNNPRSPTGFQIQSDIKAMIECSVNDQGNRI